MFASGSRDTIGLAQAYLYNAQKELDANGVISVIPFSDPSLFGAFAANLVSNLNRSGIRRRYAGMGAVQVPSRGMIQVYHLGGKTYLDSDMRKHLYQTLAQRNIHRFDNADNLYTREEYEENREKLLRYDPFADTYENYVECRSNPLDFYSKHTGIYNPLTEQFELTPDEAHPFISKVDPIYLEMNETVLLVDENNSVEPVVLNNFKD